MPSQNSQLSFPADKSTTSPQSTENESPNQQVNIKPSQHSSQLPLNIKTSKYFLAAQAEAQKYEPTFLGIPQSIRDQIYHHTFSNALVHISRRHRYTTPTIKQSTNSHILFWTPLASRQSRQSHVHYTSSRNISILSVSKQTRKEALPFYISLSVFQVHGPASMCADWLQTFPVEDLRMLKEVRFSDPYEHLSILAGALRKNAARESVGGILGEMAKKGVGLEDGVLRVRCFEGGKVKWKSVLKVKVELGLTVMDEGE